jgi:hypothetical protein
MRTPLTQLVPALVVLLAALALSCGADEFNDATNSAESDTIRELISDQEIIEADDAPARLDSAGAHMKRRELLLATAGQGVGITIIMQDDAVLPSVR